MRSIRISIKEEGNKIPQGKEKRRWADAGYASPYAVPPNLKFQEGFLKANREARRISEACGDSFIDNGSIFGIISLNPG